MNSLSDDLLRLIIGPFFEVPEEHFAHNGNMSLFSKAPQSAAELLRVCKRWMRFATPLLYSTVIIRTKKEAASLSTILTNNAEFGAYICRLRLEEVFGEFITPAVIRTMPNVQQMCFPIDVSLDSNTEGLVTAFGLFKLERVVVLSSFESEGISNQTMTQLIANLATAVPTWTTLNHFTFPQSYTSPDTDTKVIEVLGPALCLAPNLKTVTIGCYTIMNHSELQSTTAAFIELVQKPGLEHFIVQGLAGFQPALVRHKFSRCPADVQSRIRLVSSRFCRTSFVERQRPAVI